MLKQEFNNYILDNIENYLPDEFSNIELEICKNTKANITYDMLRVKRAGYNIGPAINISKLYELHESGIELEALIEELAEIIENAFEEVNRIGSVDIRDMLHDVYSRVKLMLINTQKNEEYLKTVPHMNQGDLSVIYVMDCGKDFPGGSVTITNHIVEMENIDLFRLHEAALSNTYDPDTFLLTPISRMFGLPLPDRFDEIYVCSLNANEKYGAAVLMYEELLDKAAEKIQGDFYVLPSSMCEVLFLKADESLSVYELREMVEQVNKTEFVGELYLSDSVYEYDSKLHKLQVASDSKEIENKSVVELAQTMTLEQKESFIEEVEITVDYSYGHTISDKGYALYEYLTKERYFRDIVSKDGLLLKDVPQEYRTVDVCSAAVIQNKEAFKLVASNISIEVFNRWCKHIHSNRGSIRNQLKEIAEREKNIKSSNDEVKFEHESLKKY